MKCNDPTYVLYTERNTGGAAARVANLYSNLSGIMQAGLCMYDDEIGLGVCPEHELKGLLHG